MGSCLPLLVQMRPLLLCTHVHFFHEVAIQMVITRKNSWKEPDADKPLKRVFVTKETSAHNRTFTVNMHLLFFAPKIATIERWTKESRNTQFWKLEIFLRPRSQPMDIRSNKWARSAATVNAIVH